MTLGELIKTLESAPPETKVRRGLGSAHSDRGSYENLAFEPFENTTVAAMLIIAKAAVGMVFNGWKGGEYRMSLSTEIFIGKWGDCGSEITPELLWVMIPGEIKVSCYGCDGTGERTIKCDICEGTGMRKAVDQS